MTTTTTPATHTLAGTENPPGVGLPSGNLNAVAGETVQVDGVWTMGSPEMGALTVEADGRLLPVYQSKTGRFRAFVPTERYHAPALEVTAMVRTLYPPTTAAAKCTIVLQAPPTSPV